MGDTTLPRSKKGVMGIKKMPGCITTHNFFNILVKKNYDNHTHFPETGMSLMRPKSYRLSPGVPSHTPFALESR